MKKKIVGAFVVFLIVFASAAFVKIKAGTGQSGMGFLWGPGAGVTLNDGKSTNVGWISMNSESTKATCDANNNGFTDAVCGGADNATTPFQNYGVNIPSSDGPVTGHAWSENLGWISFDSIDLTGCPTGCVSRPCTARRVGDTLVGWARIMSIKTELAANNSGGWQGWVSLNDTNCGIPGYGVTINGSNLGGYAWSDELGWINFSGASIVVAKTIIGQVTANPNLVASSSTPVTVTATVTGGTATGNNISYQLDCTNDGTFEETYNSTTGELTHAFATTCKYSSSSTASVKITRDGVNISPVASITFGCMDSVCNTTTYACESILKTSGCSSSCNATNCKRPPSNNWKETPVQ